MKIPLKLALLLNYLNAFVAVFGCGPLPGGQERTISFNISNFKLPAAMAYSMDNSATSLAPTISTTEEAARAFVKRVVERSISIDILIVQTDIQNIDDVLYQQGRAAGLSDDVISLILQQLSVEVNYTPLHCVKVFNIITGMAMMLAMMMINCQIIDGTVMSTCTPQAAVCDLAMANILQPISSQYTTISGKVMTNNIIMANWSREMWQIALNRVVQTLRSGPLASNFYGATVVLN